MKTIHLFLISMILATGLNAQDSKFDTLSIKTSAQCELCKERIEEALAFARGVKRSELDLNTKKVAVAYRPDKTSPGKIREAISRAGYDADDVPADTRAYSKLPACCKKPDDPDYEGH